jgi:hypothetical protein
MRSLARISLGMLGLALVAPRGVEAQYAPSTIASGYQPAAAPSPSAAPVADPAQAQAAAPVPIGPDGKPIPAPAAEAPHKHRPFTVCAKCAAKLKANNGMPPGTIVGCAHSKNGVCTACRAALNMPGQFVMASAPGQPAQAPGRAVASSSPSPSASAYSIRTGGGAQAAVYDGGMGEPAPVGVVQANFSQGGPAGSPAGNVAPSQANAPGHAVAESLNNGNDPYQAKSGPFPHPHIIGHLLGWSGLGAEKAEAKAWKKAEAHARLTYDENGTAAVDELPASSVYGKKH